jgi:acetate kinase
MSLDGSSNYASGGDRLISSERAEPAVVVVHAREDLEIARQVRNVLSQRWVMVSQ